MSGNRLLGSLWKPLNGAEQFGTGRLIAALLTTFDPPDPSVLIEDYLPRWLGLRSAYTEDGTERLRYFAELEEALRQRRGRIAIVSSPGAASPSADGWIWNYIRRFEVGAVETAVQHAKLWMFHRAAVEEGGPETLEIFVSSANLTRDGLRNQIQGAWRCVLPLYAGGSNSREKSWGCLPGFLSVLGGSVGMDGTEVTAYWRQCLRRCTCPDGVDFVASVPGVHKKATLDRRISAWGVAGLGGLWRGGASRRMAIMTPTIGRWTPDGFGQWANRAGVKPGSVSLGWIREGHPWSGSWQLDRHSEEALTDAGVDWREMPGVLDGNAWRSPFSDEHLDNDHRWSHAKLYELGEGSSRRMLVTSANLSHAAWGKPHGNGGLAIRNFELGVAFPAQAGFCTRLPKMLHRRFALNEIDYEYEEEPPVAWIGALWDGKTLRITCRSKHALTARVTVSVARSTQAQQRTVAWKGSKTVHGIIEWRESSQKVPMHVSIRTETGVTRATAVHDVRMIGDTRMLCCEYDEDRLRDALDDVIEEQYGYQTVVDLGGTGKASGHRNGNGATGGNYAVLAYVDARRRFRLVDNWWSAIQIADQRIKLHILGHGERIHARWMRTAEAAPESPMRISARVAADELLLRIKRCK